MRFRSAILVAAPLMIVSALAQPPAKPSAESQTYLQFIKARAADLRRADKPPETLADWEIQKTDLRRNLEQAWGGFPPTPCPLEPRKLGELRRDGYRVEKIIFQTRPGVWMTANAYVPDQPGRLAAVLAVHGHWRGAKQDPVVQARNIGLARHGFFVLAVDALGAGERAVGKALGEYHGSMVAATLWPVGLALSGLQVYENMRAVDYLLTRPEVDPARIGITGASGGGNQTMYSGAWDQRLAASVPVCSVGNYQAYLGAACCMCEVLPGALAFTEEWRVLGLTAPRGLMVMNATEDSIQFSVGEAKKSLALAQPVFDLYGKHDHLTHVVIVSKHDYGQPMREAMYGWMARHLKRQGAGTPIGDPEIKTEDPEALRCFPGESRPDDYVTIPRFAAAEARKILTRFQAPPSARSWRDDSRSRQVALLHALGGTPPVVPLSVRSESASDGNARVLTFESEAGLTLTARHERAGNPAARLAVLLDLDGAEKAGASTLAGELRRAGWSLLLPELRATGRYAWPRDRAGTASDHNTAQWGLWLGRPLLGQWTVDVRRALDALADRNGNLPPEITVVGTGPAGVLAVCATVLDPRITGVATIGSLASYVTEVPFEGQRMGIMVPGILRATGDIGHLAALIAPRKLVIAGGVNGSGTPLDLASLQQQYAFTREVYVVSTATASFSVLSTSDPAELVQRLK
jgi:dienelactone hydrolase